MNNSALVTCSFALALAIGSGCATKAAAAPTSAASPLARQKAPDFSRPTLAGSKVDTASMRGKIIVVKFFAEYCEPCKRTLPAAQALHAKYGEVAFIGVSEDEYESQAQSMVDAYGLTFDVVMDRGNVLSGRFRINELPHSFVIGPNGVVEWVGGPGNNEGDLEAALLAVIDKSQP